MRTNGGGGGVGGGRWVSSSPFTLPNHTDQSKLKSLGYTQGGYWRTKQLNFKEKVMMNKKNLMSLLNTPETPLLPQGRMGTGGNFKKVRWGAVLHSTGISGLSEKAFSPMFRGRRKGTTTREVAARSIQEHSRQRNVFFWGKKGEGVLLIKGLQRQAQKEVPVDWVGERGGGGGGGGWGGGGGEGRGVWVGGVGWGGGWDGGGGGGGRGGGWLGVWWGVWFGVGGGWEGVRTICHA